MCGLPKTERIALCLNRHEAGGVFDRNPSFCAKSFWSIRASGLVEPAFGDHVAGMLRRMSRRVIRTRRMATMNWWSTVLDWLFAPDEDETAAGASSGSA